MNRSQFDHAIRASGGVLGASEIVVIGSQAVHASLPGDPPPAAQRSMEVDVVPLRDADGTMADLIDGSIGEASIFHETFGYYAQGVSESTAVLPAGWRDRLVRYETPATSGVVAWCLELHDLWISKAVAGRPKDHELCRALLEDGHVVPGTLAERLEAVPDLDSAPRERVRAWVCAPGT